jgi:hypothetical protein
MLFVDAYKFKNKPNKSAYSCKAFILWVPSLSEWEITIVNAILNLISFLTFKTHQYTTYNLYL